MMGDPIYKYEEASMSERDALKALVVQAQRLHLTPVVDNDFPAVMEDYRRAFENAKAVLARPRPKVVCLCGSTRFYEAYQRLNYELTMAGHIVLSVGHYPHVQRRRMIEDGCMGEQEVMVEVVAHGANVGCTPGQKKALDELHLRKIDMADELLILNVNGYVGESTRNEIAYAKKLGKPVNYLEGDKAPPESNAEVMTPEEWEKTVSPYHREEA